MKKLEIYGMLAVAKLLLNSYLNDCRQYVSVTISLNHQTKSLNVEMHKTLF